MDINNETIGISAEVAIATAFKLSINPDYKSRANTDVVNILLPRINGIFVKERIPSPIQHIAEGNNSKDFLLNDSSSLSVKTNKKALDKVAPQIIGQPTSRTYFEYFGELFSEISDKCNELTYAEKRALFKDISQKHIKEVIEQYWYKLFECDHLLYFYQIVSKTGALSSDFNYLYIMKPDYVPRWDERRFKFTKTLGNWNESCTVKYQLNSGRFISIGEFQVHQNRDCLKFRFNMKGLLSLIENDSI